MQNVSHENDLICMRMNVHVTYTYILNYWFCTKTRFETEAKVDFAKSFFFTLRI